MKISNGKAVMSSLDLLILENKGMITECQGITFFLLNGYNNTVVIDDTWAAQDIEKSEYVGVIEFQSNDQEHHVFEIVKTDVAFVFGGACNTGLLQSGYMQLDDCFSIDENLQELIEDLKCFYNDGAGSTSNIIVNERM